jgi:hypothetical protein
MQREPSSDGGHAQGANAQNPCGLLIIGLKLFAEMSTSFTALIAPRPADFDALAFLQKVAHPEVAEVPAKDARNPKSGFDHRDTECYEIGMDDQWVWIKNYDYTERFFKRNPTTLNKAYEALGKPTQLLVVKEYDNSGDYGFALYTEGKFSRLFNASIGDVDEAGAILPEEKPWLEGKIEEEEDDDGDVWRTYINSETGMSCEEEDLGLELTRCVMKARIGLMSEDLERKREGMRYFKLPVQQKRRKEE